MINDYIIVSLFLNIDCGVLASRQQGCQALIGNFGFWPLNVDCFAAVMCLHGNKINTLLT